MSERRIAVEPLTQEAFAPFGTVIDKAAVAPRPMNAGRARRFHDLAQVAVAGADGQVVIGFAAETEQDPERILAIAREKAARKGVDFLVLNRVGWAEGFATAENAVTVLDGRGSIVGEAAGDKLSVAHRILDVLV